MNTLLRHSNRLTNGIPAELPSDNLLPFGHTFGQDDEPVKTKEGIHLVPVRFSEDLFGELYRKVSDPNLLDQENSILLADRLINRRIAFDEDTGCWELPLTVEYDEKGQARYPQLDIPEFGLKNCGAHRASLSIFRNITLCKGNHVDHLCRRQACCNPYHLEEVPPVVNSRRGVEARFVGELGVARLFYM